MKKTALLVDNSINFSQYDMDMIKPDKIVPINYIINGEEYSEFNNLTREKFFDFLTNNSKISTSQPAAEIVREAWRELLKDHDEVLYILISSGLSGSYSTASMASLEDEFKGKVFVVDNKQVAQTNKMAMFEARYLIDNGQSAEYIKKQLEDEQNDSRIFLAVSTLKYLKNGGRVNALEATIGTLLNIKPIIRFTEGSLYSHCKVISMSQAKQKLISLLQKEIETSFMTEMKEGKLKIAIAHSFKDENDKELLAFKDMFKSAFPNIKFMSCESLPLFIICHTGPNAIGVGFVVDRYDTYTSQE